MALSILEELPTERRVLQCRIRFSNSRAIIWTVDDPLRYLILDQGVQRDPDICLVCPSHAYPTDAAISRTDIARILVGMRALRLVDTTIYQRTASIIIINGTASPTFSCDG